MQNLSQVWLRIQGTLLPFLRCELDPITEKQEKLIAVLEIVRIEDFIKDVGCVPGRPPSDRQALGRSYVAKAFYNMNTTAELIERLKGCPNLRRICGFERASEVPDESTFSRAFSEFAALKLPSLVHAALIKSFESPRLVGHISRDSTEIEAREKPAAKQPKPKKAKRKRGRPRKGEEPEPKQASLLEQQVEMSLPEMISSLPKACDYGAKKDSKGFSHTWTGYKLHIVHQRSTPHFRFEILLLD